MVRLGLNPETTDAILAVSSNDRQPIIARLANKRSIRSGSRRYPADENLTTIMIYSLLAGKSLTTFQAAM
jgi:hypothetical protein